MPWPLRGLAVALGAQADCDARHEDAGEGQHGEQDESERPQVGLIGRGRPIASAGVRP